METLELKKAIFYPTEIVFLKKKGNIAVSIEDIKEIAYEKLTFFNCLMAGLLPDGNFPGYMQIHLNKKINNTKLYLVKIKFGEVLKLPEFYLRKIDPSNNWGAY